MIPVPSSTPYWTRNYLFSLLREHGIHHVFGLPGPDLLPLLEGTYYPENDVTYIEHQRETSAIEAAMDMARITGRPGVVVLQATPSIAHRLANLFRAAHSNKPLVIVCCQQPSDLLAPLPSSILLDMARQHTRWVHEVRSAEEMPTVLQRAFSAAMTLPGSPVFVAMPCELTTGRNAERTAQLAPPSQKPSADDAGSSSLRCRSSFWTPRRTTPVRSADCKG